MVKNEDPIKHDGLDIIRTGLMSRFGIYYLLYLVGVKSGSFRGQEVENGRNRDVSISDEHSFTKRPTTWPKVQIQYNRVNYHIFS